MVEGFSLSEEQKKAFESILSDKSKISTNLSKSEAAFDSFNSLIGAEKVLTEIKSKLPFSFSGQSLFICDSSNSKDVLVALAKFCAVAGFTPVLVLFGSNYKTVSKLMRDSGFSKRFILLDCVSKNIAPVEETESVYFVDSLRNLTQMQIRISNIADSNSRVAFIFDSLMVLNLYHEDEVVLKFVYSLTKLLRRKNMPAHYITSDKATLAKFSQFFDETIELKKFY